MEKATLYVVWFKAILALYVVLLTLLLILYIYNIEAR